MRLTFLGHAGFLIENKNTLLIIDPWVSKKGAFDSAWLQLPCNHHLAPLILNKIKEFENIYVYVSHEHKDHFDVGILSEIFQNRSDTTFLIPNFKSKYFVSELKALGPKQVIELSNDESYKAGEIDLFMFIDESGINHDSAILVNGSGHTFLNLNDCKIFDRLEFIKNKFGSPDIFTAQFSGASWHPVCYDMPELEYKIISKKKKLSKYRAITNALKTLKPKRYLPSAGPPALLDPMHYEINFHKDSTFPKQFDVINFLSPLNLDCQLDSIMPGDVYCFETDRYLSLAAERVSEENFESYLEHYAKQTKHLFAENEQSTPTDLHDLFQRYYQKIAAKAAIFSIKESIQHILYFAINEVKEKFIRVDLNTKLCDVVTTLPLDNYNLITYPAWQIHRLVEDQIRGEDLALSFRGRMKRAPDVYNTWISCFVNSEIDNLTDNIHLIETIKDNKERIVVNCNGVRYQIRRYCPHQGADLQYGWCEGNNWVCPKHRWHYNLEKGGMCESANASVEAEKLPD